MFLTLILLTLHYKTIHHTFFAACFKHDVEFVAVYVDDFAVAEFIVENAVTSGIDCAVFAADFAVEGFGFWFFLGRKPTAVPMA